jgi:hypothetical protein
VTVLALRITYARKGLQFGVPFLAKDCSCARTSYHLTSTGQELDALIDVLLTWGALWTFGEPDPTDLDPLLLLWWMRSRICIDQLPQEHIVVQFDFYGATTGTYWLLITTDDVSICLTPPGFELDLLLKADLATFYQIWLGRIRFAEALRERTVELEGTPALVRSFPNLLALSLAAATMRREQASGLTS